MQAPQSLDSICSNSKDIQDVFPVLAAKETFKGHCVCRDGLTPVLDAIRESDGLIIGSPNYLSEMTASFRAFPL